MDTDAPGNILYFGGAVRTSMPVVFHLMAAVRGEFSAFIGTDITVYEFVRDILSAFLHVCRNLFGRPVLILQQIQRLPYYGRIFRAVGCRPLPSFHCFRVSLVPQIVALLSGVPSDFTAES